MSKIDKNYLHLSQKLAILASIFDRKSIRPILDECSTAQLVQAHAFLWDKLVEIHCLTQATQFDRHRVTQNMMSSATYQREQKCDLPLDYCKGVECVWSNPECAGNKIKNNMEIMAKSIIKNIESSPKRSHRSRALHQAIKSWVS